MIGLPPALVEQARGIVATATARRLTITTAESCTGGLVAALLTEIPGSSSVFKLGLVTYSNTAKTDFLGVAPELLDRVGAVSDEVAHAMAEGALRRIDADLSIAVTGIAGPGGGSLEKPVGLVHFACASRLGPTIAGVERLGDVGRAEIRLASAAAALDLLRQALADQAGVDGP